MMDKVNIIFLIPVVDGRYSSRELLKINLLLSPSFGIVYNSLLLGVVKAIAISSIISPFYYPSQLGGVVVSSSLWEGEPSSPGPPRLSPFLGNAS